MKLEGSPPVALRETCRLVGGRVPLWRYHRARLASGGCGDAVLERADAAMLEAARSWAGPASSRLRLTLVVSAAGTIDATVQRRLSSLDVPGGPRLAAEEVAEPPELPPGAAKPADRSYWDDAQRRARAFLLDALAEAGTRARVGPLPLSYLEHADDVFLTNAFGGFAAVRGRGGSGAAAVAREAFARLWAG